ncbi:MAG TPA: glycosyltransferase family 39 protein [Xanthobacteraceae bacterium]
MRVWPGRVLARPGDLALSQPLAITVGLYALAFLVPAWPWLSGAVAIPWDAESQFRPQVMFLARALATGQSPFWTPNVFAGWPQISDPQALIFSPLHFLLAWLDQAPSALAVDRVTFVYLFLGGLGIIFYFRDRGWHPAGALVAALAFAFGGSANSRLQHTIQIISLCYLAIALWLLARALDRGSWRWGVAAGVAGGLLAVDRDHIALLSLYVLVGAVIAHLWPAPRARRQASLKPLAAAGAVGCVIAAIPVTMTALLAVRSNRPEIGCVLAEHGSLHPADLLMLAFADVFHGMAPNVEFWGPPSPLWHKAFGSTGLWLSKNMGMIYSGAVPLVALVSFGLVRGHAWSREIRFFAIAAVLVLLYALGWYTPAFRVMYTLMPGIDFFRRPADATFVLGALIAVMAGYCVHCWLAGAVAPPTRRQRAIEIGIVAALVVAAVALAVKVVGASEAVRPVMAGLVGAAAAIAALALARACGPRAPFAAATVLATAMALDFAWNDAPHISTGLPPATFAALAPNTHDPTVRLIEARLAAADAAPDRRDRVEMINIAYHWQNLSLAHDFDHVFGHNPLRLRWFYEATHVGDYIALASQRVFSPLYPSYRSAFADLFGVRLIVTGVPVEVIDKSLRPGDLALIARTKDAYIYENPRALPRVMVLGDWQLTDFNRLYKTGWPAAVDPRQTLLLDRTPKRASVSMRRRPGTARILRYANAEVDVAVDAPDGGFLLLTDVWHPWWRATLDGKPVDVLRADAIFRAVALPPGAHEVRFTFAPFAGAATELAQLVGLAR